MNTVDPNLKVQQQFAPPVECEAAPAAEPQQQAPAGDGVDYKMNGHVQEAPAQPAAALPQYHHHRSTALW